MQIVEMSIDEIKPYEKNAKKHPTEQVEHIANSIKEFGFQQPLVIDKDGVLVIGHGRLLASKKLGLKMVPVVRADELTEEQIKALRLADNKTNESEWDFDLLNEELDGILDFDMEIFGFDKNGGVDLGEDNPYTDNIQIPQYEVMGEPAHINDLYDSQKSENLITEIMSADGITDEERNFLVQAAKRHIVFNYQMIAEYYASANKEMQELMEKSALVIIDYDNAIANGYVELSRKIEEIKENEK